MQLYKLMIISSAILLIGCGGPSDEYKEFVKKYDSDTRTFCDGNFLMGETFLSEEATSPQVYLINSNICK